jgi:hypothetical protein
MLGWNRRVFFSDRCCPLLNWRNRLPHFESTSLAGPLVKNRRSVPVLKPAPLAIEILV